MTTPRDDIAGLSVLFQLGALREERDALSARVKELEGINANLCRDKNTLLVVGSRFEDRWRLAEARALRAEHERDELAEECSAYASQNTNLRNDLVLSGMARDAAEQERDEAIKLIRPLTILAEDSAALLSNHNSNLAPEMYSLAARARSFVRRLAAGPEKEKK